jgi:tellurite resistance protein TehA-like permease
MTAKPVARAHRGLAASFDAEIASLPPAYFALVMATGVLGVGCGLLHIPAVPQALYWISLVSYVVLWALQLLRITRHWSRFFSDFASHVRGPGYFTMVAATSVVGITFAVQRHRPDLARAMWWIAFALWLVLTYAVFTALTVKRDKPDLAEGINGGWLTAVVATQSLVVLGAIAPPLIGTDPEMVVLGLVSLWLAGGMLYIWMISLIFYRYTFFRFLPSDLMPPYWINMGAMAISTLAGALLIKTSASSHLLTSLHPFLEGFTLLFWATATWWIPMLFVLGIWRHGFRKVPLTYDPLYWGAVFPLAMYTTATFRLAEALHAPFLFAIPKVFVVFALSMWLMTFLGLILHMIVGVVRSAR